MARKRDRANNKQKIMSSAGELFYRFGYHGTSVDDILAHSEVVKSNFYYHFKSKEELAIAVMDAQVEQFSHMVLGSLRDDSRAAGERLDRFFTDLAQSQTRAGAFAGCPFGNLAASLPSSGADPAADRFRSRLSQVFRDVEGAITQCLAEGMRAGTLPRTVSAPAMATLILGAVEGLMLLTKTHEDAGPLISGLSALRELMVANTETPAASLRL